MKKSSLRALLTALLILSATGFHFAAPSKGDILRTLFLCAVALGAALAFTGSPEREAAKATA